MTIIMPLLGFDFSKGILTGSMSIKAGVSSCSLIFWFSSCLASSIYTLLAKLYSACNCVWRVIGTAVIRPLLLSWKAANLICFSLKFFSASSYCLSINSNWLLALRVLNSMIVSCSVFLAWLSIWAAATGSPMEKEKEMVLSFSLLVICSWLLSRENNSFSSGVILYTSKEPSAVGWGTTSLSLEEKTPMITPGKPIVYFFTTSKAPAFWYFWQYCS